MIVSMGGVGGAQLEHVVVVSGVVRAGARRSAAAGRRTTRRVERRQLRLTALTTHVTCTVVARSLQPAQHMLR